MDIVEQLRECAGDYWQFDKHVGHDAANEIERLRCELDLRERQVQARDAELWGRTQEILALRKDAERYRWLREQHEGVETLEDAEGFTYTEPTAAAFTVFKPGKRFSLEPVSCWPGELDAAIDAAMAQAPNVAIRGSGAEAPDEASAAVPLSPASQG